MSIETPDREAVQTEASPEGYQRASELGGLSIEALINHYIQTGQLVEIP